MTYKDKNLTFKHLLEKDNVFTILERNFQKLAIECIRTCFLIIQKISIWKKSKFDIWVFMTSSGSGTMGYGLRRPKKVVWASNIVLGLCCEPIITFSHTLQFNSLIPTKCSKSVSLIDTYIDLECLKSRASKLLSGRHWS